HIRFGSPNWSGHAPQQIHSRRERKMRYFARLAVSVLLLPAVCGRSALAADRPPNILLIFSDDHAAHAVGCYGSKINETPNLDRIARQGMRFANCLCTNALCGPSPAVVLTGKYSHLNCFYNNVCRFERAAPTVPK